MIDRFRLWTIASFLAIGVLLCSNVASAYPWMIRHGYTQCATCHTDPGGAGLLTPYGRAQSELLLSAKFTGKEPEEEASRTSEFALGAFALPEWLALQSWVRAGRIWNLVDGAQVDGRSLLMRADLGAYVKSGWLRASGTVGVARNSGASLSHEAWLTSSLDKSGVNLLSREHWIGISLLDERALLRAGRLNLPFGLRNLEHTSYVRQTTRTDVNQQQQHGISFAYGTEATRAEGMIVLGNFQTGPDEYRERGLVGTVETSIARRLALGVNALALHAGRQDGSRNVWRQAYGLHIRYSPWEPLALLSEFDATLRSAHDKKFAGGYAMFTQADIEPWRGLHFVVSVEAMDAAVSEPGWLRRVGVGAAFFPLVHLDVRADYYRTWPSESLAIDTILLQLHGYL